LKPTSTVAANGQPLPPSPFPAVYYSLAGFMVVCFDGVLCFQRSSFFVWTAPILGSTPTSPPPSLPAFVGFSQDFWLNDLPFLVTFETYSAYARIFPLPGFPVFYFLGLHSFVFAMSFCPEWNIGQPFPSSQSHQTALILINYAYPFLLFPCPCPGTLFLLFNSPSLLRGFLEHSPVWPTPFTGQLRSSTHTNVQVFSLCCLFQVRRLGRPGFSGVLPFLHPTGSPPCFSYVRPPGDTSFFRGRCPE